MWSFALALGWRCRQRLHGHSGTGRIHILRLRLRTTNRVRRLLRRGLNFPHRVIIGPINPRLKGTIQDNG